MIAFLPSFVTIWANARPGFYADIRRKKADWEEMLAARRDSTEAPFTSQRPLGVLRQVLDRNGIILAGSGDVGEHAAAYGESSMFPRLHENEALHSSSRRRRSSYQAKE
jgi:thiamine pyrophosphate-dependent acetolactate synthase large subunit-like protein